MVDADGPKLPSGADIDAVLAFLPLLERPDFQASRWTRQGSWIPRLVDAPEVQQLQQALARHGFVVAFDWPSWRAEAEHYQSDPATLAGASLADVCRLLTVHLRSDRFVAGQFASAVASGQIAAILRRLRAIRDEELAVR
ncbi:DUF6508 domain-containing protein [Nannocystis radixulma]|uniref:DUF6508 domain-containing protein n=1 Tax=Nannocystis radixulma TaxID=2995305 RepID=A0ABT5BDX9_9BACT|nr:DUF6508 domain-containing protein [Nannocystis radixulma]MDC0672343.1 DUF6508 domain-containing protein [Nannocystis radixulma]